MVVDLDDFCEDDNRLDLLERLREINPAFKLTVFAIPARGSEEFWKSIPDWIELAVHGWWHPHPRESEHWSYEQTKFVFAYCDALFAHGFKAPGWQISPATYQVAMEAGWWVADHWDNDGKRPQGLLTHRIAPDYRETPDHWHGHIPNVCGNGIEETFDELSARVYRAESFEFISERVEPWG